MELHFLDFLQTLRNPVLDAVMVFITSMGNAGMVWILLALILIIRRKDRPSGIMIFCAVAIAVVLCSGILKNVFMRTRPCDLNRNIQLLIQRPTDYSFPSGHTAASFACASALYFAGNRKLFKPVLVLSCLIAFSRMYLYVHYPTDILGGIAVGILSGYVSHFLVNKYYENSGSSTVMA